ncbi:MAG: hypothetical protein WB660_27975 [Candidatus Sulfotelmatobacter sp.]
MHFLLGTSVKIADDGKHLAAPTLPFDAPSEDFKLSSLTGRTAPGFDKSPVNTDGEMLGGLRIFPRMVYLVTKFSLYFLTHGERPIAIGHRRKAARFRQQLLQEFSSPAVRQFG